MLSGIYDGLKLFNASKLLKKGVLMFVANYFDLRHEKRRLMEYFDFIDMDDDGELSFDELAASYCFKVGARVTPVRPARGAAEGAEDFPVLELGAGQAGELFGIFQRERALPGIHFQETDFLRVRPNRRQQRQVRAGVTEAI